MTPKSNATDVTEPGALMSPTFTEGSVIRSFPLEEVDAGK